MKTVATLCALALCALLLAGCSAKTENDVSACVMPETFGGDETLSQTPPSAGLPAREKAERTMPTYQYDAAEPSGGTVYTCEMRYRIERRYFIGEELTFGMPLGWDTGNFRLVINEQTSNGYALRQMLFYLIDSQTAQAALVMKIDSVPADYQARYGVEYGAQLGTSYDGSHVYMRAAVAGDLPSDFGDAELYSSVLAAVTAEGYPIQLNV